MPFEDQNLFASKILDDIQRCLERSRVDEQILYFIHIYTLLEIDLQEQKELKELFNELNTKFQDIEFMKHLEFYYAISTGEEGRLLFDPTVSYNPKYDFDNFSEIYQELNSIKLKICRGLGMIKNKLFVIDQDLMKGW